MLKCDNNLTNRHVHIYSPKGERVTNEIFGTKSQYDVMNGQCGRPCTEHRHQKEATYAAIHSPSRRLRHNTANKCSVASVRRHDSRALRSLPSTLLIARHGVDDKRDVNF